ncbi:MAG: YheT family hydrolase [Cyclobacteriaceae bacterium]
MEYTPPLLFFNAHVETIFPAIFRRVQLRPYIRERIQTPDGDFLDLDWLKGGFNQLAILSHGLEGNSSRAYIKGMARILHQAGFDVLAWNYRGCSEEMNRQLRFYHSGATDDLNLVIEHASPRYPKIALIGFSLGGNLTLKYLGENRPIPPSICSAVTLSVPLDLHQSCMQISKPSNRLYAMRFLISLKNKIKIKARAFPELGIGNLQHIKTLIDFDDAYTAPLHGFRSAMDYYHRCSSIHFINQISIPTLIINARNDPFLGKACFPAVADTQSVSTSYPARGGHVGFTLFDQNGLYWSELRALQFIQQHV